MSCILSGFELGLVWSERLLVRLLVIMVIWSSGVMTDSVTN